jgi:hydroxymethylbilane synthase
MSTVIKLGTRKSILAWAQSSWVAQQIQAHNAGVKVQLIGIETRGDQIQNIPLYEADGKDFFVAELDHALTSGKVDFTVHSMKDLSLNRPTELVCAAIPPRENPRDVVIFGPHALQRLAQGKSLKIGSSSPRRRQNVPAFLVKALPKLAPGAPLQLEWVEVRGNVNTRLARIHEAPDGKRYLDGVVLAFAGLIRLWADVQGRSALKPLLANIRWMVLPLQLCPAAPAQGALAIECRSGDSAVQKALEHLHCPATAAQVSQERAILAEWGGGCHQELGATALAHPELGSMLFVKGVKPNGERLESLTWNQPPHPQGDPHNTEFWDGSHWRLQRQTSDQKPESRESTECSAPLHPACLEVKENSLLFVTHWRAWPSVGVSRMNGRNDGPILNQGELRIWTSGISSWFVLASQGVWVDGCAEGFGFNDLQSTLSEGVLALPPPQCWSAVTHGRGLEEWRELGIRAIPTYQIDGVYSEDAKEALRAAKFVFWSSGSQFDELRANLAIQAHQSCGPGKTAARIRSAGFQPLVFPSVEEWRKWLKIHL